MASWCLVPPPKSEFHKPEYSLDQLTEPNYLEATQWEEEIDTKEPFCGHFSSDPNIHGKVVSQ